MLCFTVSGAWTIRADIKRQNLKICVSPNRQQLQCLAGFGTRAGDNKENARNSDRGSSKKKPRSIRATYLELMQKGAQEFVCYARAEGAGEKGWRRVGTIVAENDDYCAAVTQNKRAILEHAKRLHPPLAIEKTLEVAIGKSEEGSPPPTVCQRTEGSVTSAFSPDAVSSGPFYSGRDGSGKRQQLDSSYSKTSSPGFRPRRTGDSKTPSD